MKARAIVVLCSVYLLIGCAPSKDTRTFLSCSNQREHIQRPSLIFAGLDLHQKRIHATEIYKHRKVLYSYILPVVTISNTTIEFVKCRGPKNKNWSFGRNTLDYCDANRWEFTYEIQRKNLDLEKTIPTGRRRGPIVESLHCEVVSQSIYEDNISNYRKSFRAANQARQREEREQKEGLWEQHGNNQI